MKSFDQFNYSNIDLPEPENLDEESLEELFGQIRKAGKLLSRMTRSANSGGKQLELPLNSPSPIQRAAQKVGTGVRKGVQKVGKGVEKVRKKAAPAVRAAREIATNPTTRMIGSAIAQGARAYKKEFDSQPKISSTAPGTGFGPPMGGTLGAAGAGVKAALTKGQRFEPTTRNDDGTLNLGKRRPGRSPMSGLRSYGAEKILGAKPVRDQNKDKKDGKVPVTSNTTPRSQTPESEAKTKSRKPSSYTSKSPEDSKASALVRRDSQLAKTPGTPEYQVNKDVENQEKNMKVKAGQESETTGRPSTGSASPEAKKNFEKIMSNMRASRKRLPGSSPNQKRLGSGKSSEEDGPDNKDLPIAVRGGVAAADRSSKQPLRRTGLGNTKAANQQDDAEFKKFLSKTKPDAEVTRKRRNIKNPKYYDTDEKTGKKTFNQQRYDDDKNSVKTKSGGGRPSATQSKLNKAEKSGAMADAKKKNPIRIRRGNKEVIEDQFSWREEFIWETEKIPSKKKDGRGMHPHKEIKPMTGKNTIIVNPEDKDAKYKRGY